MTRVHRASEYLAALRRDVVDLSTTVSERFSHLDPPELLRRRSPGSWSVAECLAHLIATNSGYLFSIDQALRRAGSVGADSATFRGGPLAAWFIGQAGPVVLRKYKAPKVFAPKAADVGPGVVDAFLGQQPEIVSLMERAEGADLTRIKVPSPASSLIKFRLGDAFRLIVDHEKRHVLQAIRVTGDPSEDWA